MVTDKDRDLLIKLDKSLFTDHIDFWRQLIDLNPPQRMVLWASIQRQAYREIGMDYNWENQEPVPALPKIEAAEAQDTVIDTSMGNYL